MRIDGCADRDAHGVVYSTIELLLAQAFDLSQLIPVPVPSGRSQRSINERKDQTQHLKKAKKKKKGVNVTCARIRSFRIGEGVGTSGCCPATTAHPLQKKYKNISNKLRKIILNVIINY
jgi:hypothetical protein